MNLSEQDVLNQNAATYDLIPYQSKPFSASHPALLNGLANLFGLEGVPLNKARVLELGCASGGNLIPLAYYYPGIELVGVDLSEIQVKEGQELIKTLGLEKQVSLHQMSITDIPESFGQFDYIICHGVYSWVPDFVQTGIHEVMQKHLSEQGLAYVSYNVYPGWKTLEIARDSMLFHTRNLPRNEDKVKNARNMINFMQKNAKEGTMFKEIMSNAQELISKSQDYYIAHEFLEIHNSPCYFLEMVEKAEAHDLCYLTDCNISTVFPENWGTEIRDELISASGQNQIVLEQYIDYMTNRQFRQSVFVKQDLKTKISRRLDTDKIKSLSFFVQVTKEAQPRADFPNHTHFTFKRSSDIYYRTDQEEIIAALDCLVELSGQAFHFDELVKRVKKKLGKKYDESLVPNLLQRLVILGFVLPYSTGPEINKIAQEISNKPKIAEFNRLAADERKYIVNSNHEILAIDSIAMHIIPLLDGKLTQAELADKVTKLCDDGTIFFDRKVEGQDTPERISDKKEIRDLSKNYITNLLNNLHYYGMLVS